jgi:glycosyltransferase involved in cell wall biosynthesis
MARILYFCPDFPQPSGGTKTLYRHVYRLRALGFDAAIVHGQRPFQLTWHDWQVPVIWLADRPQFHADDTLVFPETMLDYIRQTQGFEGRRVVFALSWLPNYHRLRPGERWQDYGIEAVITKSPTIQRFLAWSMGIEATLIREVIDPRLYFVPEEPKQAQIVYLTRKEKSATWLEGVFAQKALPGPAYNWVALRELAEAGYAAHLRASRIFLTTTLQEGMHVSILEAMACGCLVIGYHGIGGADFMVGDGPQQNCLLVENGDLHALGLAIEQALINLAADPAYYQPIIAQGVATARRYQDPQAESEDLKRFFGT